MSLDLARDALLAVIGLVAGSTMSAVVWRLPRGISWSRERSRCPHCDATLEVRELVPLFSWLFQRGRCHHCGAQIPWRYPVIELSCAAWAVLLWPRVGQPLPYALLALWGFLLIALLWIDLDHQLLPDALTLPGTLVGIAASLAWGRSGWFVIEGVLVGSGLLWLLGWSYWMLRRVEGMGGGDVKLAAMFGAVLGWRLTLLTLFLAALVGSIWGVGLMIRRRGGGQTPLPFGTLLAPAAMVVLLWGAPALYGYLRLFARH